MRLKAAPGAGSSYLVSLPVIIFVALLTLVSGYYGYLLMSGIALFLLILACTARVWGALSMKRVSLKVRADRTMLYPGEASEIQYTIENAKALPLIWLELAQDMPRRRCVMPEEGFSEDKRMVYEENSPSHAVPVLKRGFSFLMGNTVLTVDSRWRAICRGRYAPEGLYLRSGDGFGLARTERDYSAADVPVLFVFPRYIPVDVSMMLRDQWDCSSGRRGYVEDMTVLRGLRQYQETDNWKRINWRMAARQDEMQVNLYETIQPRSVHFILDGESFCDMSPDYFELELTLELLGSMMTKLFAAGVPCGLSLPRSAHMQSVDRPADSENSAEELLCLLAGYDCLGERGDDREIVPSCFALGATTAAAMRSGKTYIITRRAEDAAARLIPYFDRNRTVLLAYDAPDEDEQAAGIRCGSLLALRKEAAS